MNMPEGCIDAGSIERDLADVEGVSRPSVVSTSPHCPTSHPSDDWRKAAKRIDRELRDLPEPMAMAIRKLRSAQLQAELLTGIAEQVFETARRRDVTERIARAGEPPRTVVPPVHRKAILKELVERAGFLTSLRRKADEAARFAHLRRDVGASDNAVVVLDEMPVSSGTWVVEADRGFGTSSDLEAIPEGALVGIARRIADRVTATTSPGKTATASLLIWGGGPNEALAHVLDAVPVPGVRYRVVLVEGFEARGDLAQCVVERRYGLPADTASEEGTKFDFVIAIVPPPGEGVAAHFRNIYKRMTPAESFHVKRRGRQPPPGTWDGNERDIFDIGRLGPKKWKHWMPVYPAAAAVLLKPAGEAILVLPGAVRVPLTDPRHRAGYRNDPTLLADLPDALAEVDLQVKLSLDLHEENPRRQPFVSTTRPPWRVVVNSKLGSAR